MKWNGLNRSPLKKVSKDMQKKLRGYNSLVKELREGCGDRSELSGEMGDWRTEDHVEPHHIDGRDGARLTDVFNIIFVQRGEHDAIHAKNTHSRKQELLLLVKQIRLKQGYKP